MTKLCINLILFHEFTVSCQSVASRSVCRCKMLHWCLQQETSRSDNVTVVFHDVVFQKCAELHRWRCHPFSLRCCSSTVTSSCYPGCVVLPSWMPTFHFLWRQCRLVKTVWMCYDRNSCRQLWCICNIGRRSSSHISSFHVKWFDRLCKLVSFSGPLDSHICSSLRLF